MERRILLLRFLVFFLEVVRVFFVITYSLSIMTAKCTADFCGCCGDDLCMLVWHAFFCNSLPGLIAMILNKRAIIIWMKVQQKERVDKAKAASAMSH